MDLQSPPPATTIRRNPPRRAKQTPVTHDLRSTNTSNAGAASGIKPFPLGELLETELPQIIPLPDQKPPKSSGDLSNNIKVFLRIRPIECKSTQGSNIIGGETKAPSRGKIKKGIERKTPCLLVNSSSSVTLNAPPSAPDSKRAKSEIYDGFSHVFSPESLQEDIYDKVMKPLVKDFLEGHSSLLVGMGPTGSGKTYTMFGSLQQLGIVPIALRQIFCQKTVNEKTQTSRTYYLSMFEIHSERGKGEKIFDLSPESTDNLHLHTSIISVKEVKITTVAEAENIVTHGILKRSTAPTNANNQSSRSQCIVNVRCAVKNNTQDSSVSNAVLTIADLAGAERERKTGNQGARFLESNFINNTSMVFGLCLRSLLEHQRNPKKPVEKHFKNSLLTRYLQDYMEGKKRMTLILTVKAAEEDYMETSSILRQASPYMKIKFNHLDENKNAPCKRRSATVIRTERSKKRKVNNSEASLTDMNHVMMDAAPKSQISERDSAGEDCIEKNYTADFNVELQKIKSSEEVMRDFARAVWSMLKQCKHKLMEKENEVRFLKDSLREQITQTTELEKELKELRNSCSCLHNVTVGEYSKVLPFSHAISIPLISSNPDLSHGNDALLDEYCEMCLDENSESCNKVAESGMLVGGMNHLVEDLLSTPSLTVALEGERCISLFPENKDASIMQEEKKPENESLFLKDSLREHSTQATELEKVSKESTISSSCLHNPPVEECDIAPSVSHAIFVPAISLNPNLSQDNDALPDEYRTPMEEVSCDTCSIFPLEEAKELNYQYSDENSERCQKVEHSEMPVGRMDAVVMNVSKVPSLTVEPGGEGCFSLLPGNEETSVMQVEKWQKPENESLFLMDILREHNTQATELEKESKESIISSSCLHNPPVEECDKAPSVNHAIFVPPISLNPDLSQDNDALPDEYHTPLSAETSGVTEMDRGATTLDMSLFNTRSDMGKLSLPVHEGFLQQEEVSCDTCSIFPLEEAKELNYQYTDENSDRCQKVEHSEMPVGRMDASVMNVSKVPSITVELGGEGCFSLFRGNGETSVMPVEKEQLIVKVAVSEKAQQITKSHATEALRNEDEDPALRTLNSEKPKRKLLPASEILLKDFSGLVMDENAKEIKCKKAANFKGRFQGSNSLIHILKSNLPR